ncbi:MAG TPA: DUF1330 domain-containing protein [Burkholderiales bacterium]|nr:DUF1330 domain-containing protein [Burkholderiales bacterium]
MAAYVIVDMNVTDTVKIADYRTLAEKSVADYGGRFIVRGGQTEVLDGDWIPKRVVILEFPGMAEARRWRASPEYAKAVEIRNKAAKTQMILVEGLA